MYILNTRQSWMTVIQKDTHYNNTAIRIRESKHSRLSNINQFAWILFSWLLLSLPVVASLIGKIFVLRDKTTKMLPPRKLPAIYELHIVTHHQLSVDVWNSDESVLLRIPEFHLKKSTRHKATNYHIAVIFEFEFSYELPFKIVCQKNWMMLYNRTCLTYENNHLFVPQKNFDRQQNSWVELCRYIRSNFSLDPRPPGREKDGLVSTVCACVNRPENLGGVEILLVN